MSKETGGGDSFWVARAKAIQSYASLEQAMCRLFCLLARTEADVASIVFFKITNSRARIDIIDKLWKLQFKDKYNVFRNSLLEAMRPIDLKRNEIIHWNVVTINTVYKDDSISKDFTLKPPTFWSVPSDNELTEYDFEDFTVKCYFYARVMAMFDAVMRDNAGPMRDAERSAWRDIFLRPLTYPPQSDALLTQILRELQTQHQSSPR